MSSKHICGQRRIDLYNFSEAYLRQKCRITKKLVGKSKFSRRELAYHFNSCNGCTRFRARTNVCCSFASCCDSGSVDLSFEHSQQLSSMMAHPYSFVPLEYICLFNFSMNSCMYVHISLYICCAGVAVMCKH